MSFSGKYDELVYILVSVKIHIDKDMDSGPYVCDVLYYNTVTWWGCCYDTITNYSGYPENVCNNLSHENEKRGDFNMNGSDRIVSMLYIKRDILSYLFVLGDHHPKILKISKIK